MCAVFADVIAAATDDDGSGDDGDDNDADDGVDGVDIEPVVPVTLFTGPPYFCCDFRSSK